METVAVGEFKTHFSDILNRVRSGEEILIAYGKKKERVAVIVPYANYKNRNAVTLGALKDKRIVISEDFQITEEELLEL